MPRLPMTPRRAFSIIELVVVIGVIMVLLGIFLPTLGGMRQTAETSVQSTRLRQLSLTISMYANDWDDVFPIADTKPYYMMEGMKDDDPRIGRHWSWALINGNYMSLDEAIDENLYNIRNVIYSYALTHDPQTMTPTTILPWELRSLVPIRQHQASYPANKATLALIQLSYDDTFAPWCCLPNPLPGPVAFVDGSLESLQWNQLPDPNPSPILDMGHRVISTWNGIRGRDR